MAFEVGERGPGHQEYAGQVDGDDARPEVRIGLVERSARSFAGIVHQNIDWAKLSARRYQTVLDRVCIRDIKVREDEGLLPPEGACYLLKRFAPSARERDRCACFGERCCDCSTDTAAGTRHHQRPAAANLSAEPIEELLAGIASGHGDLPGLST